MKLVYNTPPPKDESVAVKDLNCGEVFRISDLPEARAKGDFYVKLKPAIQVNPRTGTAICLHLGTSQAVYFDKQRRVIWHASELNISC